MYFHSVLRGEHHVRTLLDRIEDFLHQHLSEQHPGGCRPFLVDGLVFRVPQKRPLPYQFSFWELQYRHAPREAWHHLVSSIHTRENDKLRATLARSSNISRDCWARATRKKRSIEQLKLNAAVSRHFKGLRFVISMREEFQTTPV